MSDAAPAPGASLVSPGAARHAVVATAGHVDHGKSALILRLTGMDPDRLEEERRRGLTIELGYAWRTLPSGREVGFVDVPGHERFVRTMLAGVGPVRLVLFVVAADEGWEPQSEEHLAIVDVLGVEGAVVAISKRDLVDADGLAATQAQIGERLAGTALQGAPVIACSAVTGAGMPELVDALDRMLAEAPRAADDGRTRLFVDRVFAMRGAGTVVTGTLTGAPLAIGEEVELLPSGARARIRRLQTHRRDVEVAHPIARVAANLGGDRGRIRRGEVLTHPAEWLATDVLEARLTPVRSLGSPIGSRGAFTLHAGATERDARLRLLDATELDRDGAFARIACSDPLVLDVGDRFVLRESGRRATVAGGIVVDPHPPRRPGHDAVRRLSRRLLATRDELPAVIVDERRAVRASTLRAELGTAPARVEAATPVGRWWIAHDLLDGATSAVRDELAAFHATDPLAAGVRAEALRRTVLETVAGRRGPRDADLADAIVERLVGDRVLVRDGALIRLAEHRPSTGDEARVVAIVAEAEPMPPTLRQLQAAGISRSEIDAAVRSGALVRIADDIVLTFAFVERATRAIEERGADGITVSQLRAELGTTRKYAVPLLEHLDRAGVTRRSGDVRVLRGATRPG